MYTLYVRRGKVINTDPQRRCYNGCHFSTKTEWSEWEPWSYSDPFETKEKANYTKKLFEREDLQLKVVEIK